MIVRSGWPYDGERGGRDPRQAFTPVAIVFAIVWAATTLALLVVLTLNVIARAMTGPGAPSLQRYRSTAEATAPKSTAPARALALSDGPEPANPSPATTRVSGIQNRSQ